MHLIHRQTCRVCGSSALTPVINLGLQHLQGSFVKLGMEMPPNRRIPCELVRCDPVRDQNACGLLQMKHTVPPEILYSNYWYVSGTNQTMRDHLQGIAKEGVNSMVQAPQGLAGPAAVLDIGCNDLTLLKSFPDTWNRIGIDPSDITGITGVEASGIRVFKSLFPSPEIKQIFDVITSIAMFYDLEDPVAFACKVKDQLLPTGTWIVEMSYMPAMLDMNSYDTVCHEHVEYYSLTVLEIIMKLAALKVYRVELNDINGGSIRCYVTHQDHDIKVNPLWTNELERLRIQEFDRELDANKPYAMFQSRIEEHRDQLLKLLRDLKQHGKSIHLLGASTKGNTLLQFCGIDARLIDCASDRNPMKNQAMTLGTYIQIVSEEESRSRNPDYYLVLPWHFKKEIVEREENAAGMNGRTRPKLIFPLPEIEIV